MKQKIVRGLICTMVFAMISSAVYMDDAHATTTTTTSNDTVEYTLDIADDVDVNLNEAPTAIEDDAVNSKSDVKSSKAGNWIYDSSKDKWWYKHTDGSYTKNGWEYIDGEWYLFDQSGWMLKGWQYFNNNWYLLASSGKMQTGWQQSGKYWYYLASSGEMKTGWVKSGYAWFYLADDGHMLTGWITDRGDKYYLHEDGKMALGWTKIGNNYYCFNKSGRYIENTQINRRAIILGETSTNAVPINDIDAMSYAIKNTSIDGKKFDKVVSYPNYDKADVINKIKETFANSRDEDVNYIYITCHGSYGSLLIDKNGNRITGTELHNILTELKGQFVVMIDSCHSGSMVNKALDDELQIFVDQLVSGNEKDGYIGYDRFFVLASSRKDETSFGPYGNIKNSLATNYWLLGMGWDGSTNSKTKLYADTNLDNNVSLQELYNYSYDEVLSKNNKQHIVVYPENCTFGIFGRSL